MDNKFELYEQVLKKYNYSNDGIFLSTDDIKFDFKTEIVFIKKYLEGYILFIEEDEHLYVFWLRFEYFNKDEHCVLHIKKREKDGTFTNFGSDIDTPPADIKHIKFNFVKENLSYIIGQIKSERLYLLLQTHQIK